LNVLNQARSREEGGESLDFKSDEYNIDQAQVDVDMGSSSNKESLSDRNNK
jgi:hypothetical protein